MEKNGLSVRRRHVEPSWATDRMKQLAGDKTGPQGALKQSTVVGSACVCVNFGSVLWTSERELEGKKSML